MAIHFDATAPSAAPGDMWWSGGKLALAIDDETSIQWVQISSASDVPMPGPWDFPDAPTTGQGFTPVPGGATMTWDGQMWTFPAGAAGGSMITIADSAPTGTVSNTLWWDSDSGDLFVNYNDLDSTQWVQINTKAASTSGMPDAPSDGTPYSRQDAGWVAAAAGGVTGDFLPRDGSLSMTGSLELDGANYHSINKPLTTNWAGFFLGSAGANKWEWDLTDNLDNIVLRRFGPPTPAIVVQHEHISGATTYFGPLSIRGTGGAFPAFSIKDEFVGNDIWRISAAGNNLGILSFTAASGTANPGDKFQLDLTNNRADFYCPVFVQGTPVTMATETTALEQRLIDRICLLEERLARLEAR